MRMALRRGVSSSATVLSEAGGAAFDALFRAHYPALCRFAARLSGSSAVGEEIVQQVFADLWNRWASRAEPMPERAYLYKAVRHQILDLRRHETVRRRFAVELPSTHSLPSPEVGADRTVELQDLTRAVAAAIERLPPKCREVFRLSRQDDLSYQEIAVSLGLSVKTVEGQMARAFRHLRAGLAGSGS